MYNSVLNMLVRFLFCVPCWKELSVCSRLCGFYGQTDFENLQYHKFSYNGRARKGDGPILSQYHVAVRARCSRWNSYWSGFLWSIFTHHLPNRCLTKVQGLLWASTWPSELSSKYFDQSLAHNLERQTKIMCSFVQFFPPSNKMVSI